VRKGWDDEVDCVNMSSYSGLRGVNTIPVLAEGAGISTEWSPLTEAPNVLPLNWVTMELPSRSMSSLASGLSIATAVKVSVSIAKQIAAHSRKPLDCGRSLTPLGHRAYDTIELTRDAR